MKVFYLKKSRCATLCAAALAFLLQREQKDLRSLPFYFMFSTMEESVYKTYEHNPPHLFLSNTIYMVTGATYLKRNFLQGENRKKHFLEVLFEKTKRFQWQLLFWVILDNHYHILVKSEKHASALVKLISQLHTNIARQCNKLDRVKGRKVWWNYWYSCITYERSFLTICSL